MRDYTMGEPTPCRESAEILAEARRVLEDQRHLVDTLRSLTGARCHSDPARPVDGVCPNDGTNWTCQHVRPAEL